MGTQSDPAFILFGLKHSGKTTQGKMLAKKLSYAFVDIDEAMAKKTEMSPRELYEKLGAGKFLEVEEQFCEVLGKECRGKKIVVSTGGGICDNAPAVTHLRDLGTFVFFAVPEQTAFARIMDEAVERDGRIDGLPYFIAKRKPKKREDAEKVFHDIYVERDAIYREIADIVVTLDAETVDDNFLILCRTLDIR